MLHKVKVWFRPAIHQILEEELYLAEREVIAQRERCHRLSEASAQADVLYTQKILRVNDIKAALASQPGPAVPGQFPLEF